MENIHLRSPAQSLDLGVLFWISFAWNIYTGAKPSEGCKCKNNSLNMIMLKLVPSNEKEDTICKDFWGAIIDILSMVSHQGIAWKGDNLLGSTLHPMFLFPAAAMNTPRGTHACLNRKFGHDRKDIVLKLQVQNLYFKRFVGIRFTWKVILAKLQPKNSNFRSFFEEGLTARLTWNRIAKILWFTTMELHEQVTFFYIQCLFPC